MFRERKTEYLQPQTLSPDGTKTGVRSLRLLPALDRGVTGSDLTAIACRCITGAKFSHLILPTSFSE